MQWPTDYLVNFFIPMNGNNTPNKCCTKSWRKKVSKVHYNYLYGTKGPKTPWLKPMKMDQLVKKSFVDPKNHLKSKNGFCAVNQDNLNFLFTLPETKKGNGGILNFVGNLSMMIQMVRIKFSIPATEVAGKLKNHIYRNYRLQKTLSLLEIVSSWVNPGKLFLSHWIQIWLHLQRSTHKPRANPRFQIGKLKGWYILSRITRK